jgi:hypothetical protein
LEENRQSIRWIRGEQTVNEVVEEQTVNEVVEEQTVNEVDWRKNKGGLEEQSWRTVRGDTQKRRT